MKISKIIAYAVASSCLFCSCEKNIDGEQYITEDISVTENGILGTEIIPDVTDISKDIDIVFPAKETAETEEETPVTYSTEPTRYMSEIERFFYDHGWDYFEDGKLLHRDFSSLTNHEPFDNLDSVRSEEENQYFADVERIEIDNYESVNWSCLEKFKNLNHLSLNGDDVSIVTLTEHVKEVPLESIYINSRSYDEASAQALMSFMPDCVINFNYKTNHTSDAWDRINSQDKINRLVFFTQPTLELTDAPAEEWTCTTSEINSAYYDYYDPSPIWNHKNNLVCNFANYTQDIRTVDSVQIVKGFNSYDEPLIFRNGTDSLEVGLEIDSMTRAEFVITDEMLDYSSLEAGFYLIRFTCGEDILEQNFFFIEHSPVWENTEVNDLYPEVNFLNDEQKAIFDRAMYYAAHYFGCDANLPEEYTEDMTTEEFVNLFCDAYTYDYAYQCCKNMWYIDENDNLTGNDSGGRGSDIAQYAEYFLPAYEDEDNVCFLLVLIRVHSDNPYDIDFETMNYHMLKTEDGWRFDNCRIWY